MMTLIGCTEKPLLPKHTSVHLQIGHCYLPSEKFALRERWLTEVISWPCAVNAKPGFEWVLLECMTKMSKREGEYLCDSRAQGLNEGLLFK